MNKYETMIIISPDINEEQRDLLIAKICEILTDNGAIVDVVEKLGIKGFPYSINDKNEGFFCYFKMTSSEDVPEKVFKILNTTENIIRLVIMKSE